MRVRLAVEMSGSRNGIPWPARGSVVELPDDEAQDMIRSGTAVPLSDSDKPETAVHVPADVEEATEKFIPVTARHLPPGGVELLPEEDRRPKMENIGLTDDGKIAPKYKEGTGLLTDGADVNDTPGLAQSPPALDDSESIPDEPVNMTENDGDADPVLKTSNTPTVRRASTKTNTRK